MIICFRIFAFSFFKRASIFCSFIAASTGAGGGAAAVVPADQGARPAELPGGGGAEGDRGRERVSK